MYIVFPPPSFGDTLPYVMIKERFSIGASEDAKAIRKEVFEDELGYSNDLDKFDSSCWELVLYLDGFPLSTGRIRPIDPETFLIEKVAVRKIARHQSVGTYTIKYLMNKILSLGGRYAIIHDYQSSESYYRKLGFHKNIDEPCLPLKDNKEIEMVRFLPKKRAKPH